MSPASSVVFLPALPPATPSPPPPPSSPVPAPSAAPPHPPPTATLTLAPDTAPDPSLAPPPSAGPLRVGADRGRRGCPLRPPHLDRPPRRRRRPRDTALNMYMNMDTMCYCMYDICLIWTAPLVAPQLAFEISPRVRVSVGLGACGYARGSMRLRKGGACGYTRGSMRLHKGRHAATQGGACGYTRGSMRLRGAPREGSMRPHTMPGR